MIDAVVVGYNPSLVAVNQVTNRIYVLAADLNQRPIVTVIDGTSDLTTTVPIGTFPTSLAVNSVTNKIYFTDGLHVLIMDGLTTSITTISGGISPSDPVINAVTNKIYIGNDNYPNSTVTAIDGVTDSILATISTGPYPEALDLNPVTNYVYALSNDNNAAIPDRVTVIDGRTDSTTTTLNVGKGIVGVGHGVAVNPVTNRLYVANDFDNTVSVIAGAENPSPLRFVAVTPCRAFDTRKTTPIQGGTSRELRDCRHLRHSHDGGGLLAEYRGGSARALGLSDGVADRRRSAAGVDAEFAGWPDQGQCGHRAGGSQRGHQRLRDWLRRHRCDSSISMATSWPTPRNSLAFYPLTPCRVVDTRRRSAGGP